MKNIAFLLVTSLRENVLAQFRGDYVGLPHLEVESLDDIIELSRLFHNHVDRIAVMTHPRDEEAIVIGRQSGIWNNEPANFIFLTFKGSTVWIALSGAVTVNLSTDSKYTLDFTMDLARQALPHVRPYVVGACA